MARFIIFKTVKGGIYCADKKLETDYNQDRWLKG